MMDIIKLDASHWKTPKDFYDAILPALGAPDWHGANVNALVESMVWGEINVLEPPYVVQVFSTKGLPESIVRELYWTAEDLLSAREDFKARNGRDVDVQFEIMS